MIPFISPDPGIRCVATHPHPEFGFSLALELIFKLPEHVCMPLCVLEGTLQLEVLQVRPRTAEDLLGNYE